MTFSEALEALKTGKRVSRSGWNGNGMWLKMVRKWSAAVGIDLPETFDYNPFVLMFTADQKLVPWLASQTDILSDDWGIVDAPARAEAA